MAERQIRTRAAQRPSKGDTSPTRATQRQCRLSQGDASQARATQRQRRLSQSDTGPACVVERLTQGRKADSVSGEAALGFQWDRKGLFSTDPKGVKP